MYTYEKQNIKSLKPQTPQRMLMTSWSEGKKHLGLWYQSCNIVEFHTWVMATHWILVKWLPFSQPRERANLKPAAVCHLVASFSALITKACRWWGVYWPWSWFPLFSCLSPLFSCLARSTWGTGACKPAHSVLLYRAVGGDGRVTVTAVPPPGALKSSLHSA